MELILGIDLGTTNSVVSVIRDGKPVVVEDEYGSAILPSVVGFDAEGNLLVGQEARNQQLLAPERTIQSVKRKMGEETKISLGDQQYAPQDLIIEAGTTPGSLFCVLAGTVHVMTEIPVFSGLTRQTGFARLDVGEVFGEMSLFGEEPTSTNVVAATRCEIAEINGARLNRFMEQHPDYGYRILRDLMGLQVHRLRVNNIRTASMLAIYFREHMENAEDQA